MYRKGSDIVETFRAISLTACFLGIVITIFSTLYPSQKFAKQLKIIFSLIFLLSIVKPALNGSFTFSGISEAVSASTDYYQQLSDNTDEYFIRAVESNISTTLTAELHVQNIYPEEIQTSINISENNSISISEVRIVLNDMTYSDEAKRCIIENTAEDVTVVVQMKEGNQTNE